MNLTIEELRHILAVEALILRTKEMSPADQLQAKIIIQKIDAAFRANGIWIHGSEVLG